MRKNVRFFAEFGCTAITMRRQYDYAFSKAIAFEVHLPVSRGPNLDIFKFCLTGSQLCDTFAVKWT